MTEQTTHFGTNYRSLTDIRLRKAQLRTDLTKDSNKIAGLWNELMHKPKDKNTPTQRLSGAFNVWCECIGWTYPYVEALSYVGGKHASGPLIISSAYSKRKRNKQGGS